MPFSNEIRAGASGAQSTSFLNDVTSRSLRLDHNDSSYLNFTHGTATDISKWTVNFWWKQGEHTLSYADDYVTLWGVEGPGTTSFNFIDGDLHFYLNYNSGGSQIVLRSNRKFKDPGTWYNFHVKFDRAQGTAANRLKIFVNGVDIDDQGGYSTDQRSTIASDSSSGWNVSGTSAAIGRRSGDTASRYSQGYMAYFHNIDGQYLDATDFIEIKEGICVPKLYSGSYGNNGWKLEFLQTGTGTASSSTIGADTSGNNNHWTSNNLASTDIMLDHPENNFATMNPIYHSSRQATLTQGSLRVQNTTNFSNPGQHSYGAVSTFAIPRDKKVYIEVLCDSHNGTYWYAGFATRSGLASGISSTQTGGASSVTFYNRAVMKNGTQFQYSSSSGVGGLGGGTSPFAIDDVLGMAVDGSNGNVWFSKNGTYFKEIFANNGSTGSTGDPSANTNPVATIDNVPAEELFVVVGTGNPATVQINFGQDSLNVSSANTDANGIGTFEYAVPTGYVSLCAANITDPSIGPNQDQQADDNFTPKLYTGTGSAQNITGLNFQPDWVWVKRRSDVQEGSWTDSVRGVTKQLRPAVTNPESTTSDCITSFNSDGFSLGADASGNNSYNYYTDNHVAWCWKAGGTAVSNGNGTITSSVSANTDAGFSIVSFTGNSTNPSTIGHGLSQAPEYIIYKSRDATNGTWYVSADDIGWTGRLKLEDSSSFASSTALWNDTAPTDSVFTISSSLNYNGDAIIAYCFHSVDGYCKVGTYRGNSSSTDGPFVFTDFRVAWVMGKNIDASGRWWIYDSTRSPVFNENLGTGKRLEVEAAAEIADNNVNALQLLSNGFKVNTGNSEWNSSSNDYIYLAFAENPFKFANGA